jgi:ankyrin repeat protein
MSKTLKIFAAALAASLLTAVPSYASQKQQQVPDLLPDTTIVVPADSSVGLRWVRPPLDKDKVWVGNRYASNICFSVDGSGNALIGINNGLILNAGNGYATKLSQPYTGFVHLDNDALIIATGADIGFIMPSDEPQKTPEGLPVSVFQPIASLPLPDARIFKGADDCLYFTGRDDEAGDYAVYLLKPERTADGSSTAAVIKGYKKVYSGDEPVDAVAGDGKLTFIATGGALLMVSEAKQNVTKVCGLPEGVRSLAFEPESGIFYSTGYEVGVVGFSGARPFLKTQEHYIYLRHGTMYILFKDTLGVLAIDNIGGLNVEAELDATAVPSQNDVKVSKVRFFEAGPPDYNGNGYATTFDRDKTHYVYCETELRLEQKARKRKNHLVTIVWFSPDGKVYSSESVVAGFGPRKSTVDESFCCGNDKPGSYYPGRYTVEILVDGAKSGEGSFTVEGDVTVWDAANYGDTLTLEKLLDVGADPNKPEYGFTPLAEAVENGKAKDVKLLLDHGADVNARDESGKSALMYSVYGAGDDDKEKVRLLLDHGADVKATDIYGYTALSTLFTMASNGSLYIAGMLVAGGADVNSVDKSGHSLLMTIMYKEVDPAYIEFLLSKGADPNFKNKDGASLLLLALSLQKTEYVRLLLKHGADLKTPVAAYSSRQSSLLYISLQEYLSYAETDCAKAQKAMDVTRVLAKDGAEFLPGEENIILDKRLSGLLDRGLVERLLNENDRLLTRAKSSGSPALAHMAADILLGRARDAAEKASMSHDFDTALYYCTEARDAADSAGVTIPEIYRLCGLLEWVLDIPDKAREDLGRYLSLVPDAADADDIRAVMAEAK